MQWIFLLREPGEAVILTSKDEMEYFSQKPALDHNSDPLEWWRKNEERFPALSNLAKKLFCVTPTQIFEYLIVNFTIIRILIITIRFNSTLHLVC